MFKSLKGSIFLVVGVASAFSAVADTVYLTNKEQVSPRVKPQVLANCALLLNNGARFIYTNNKNFPEPDGNVSVFKRDTIAQVFDSCAEDIRFRDSQDYSGVVWGFNSEFGGEDMMAFGAITQDKVTRQMEPLPLGNSIVMGQALEELSAKKDFIVNLQSHYNMDKLSIDNAQKQTKGKIIEQAPSWFDDNTLSRWVLDHVL